MDMEVEMASLRCLHEVLNRLHDNCVTVNNGYLPNFKQLCINSKSMKSEATEG